jgi:hypothetical protein
VVCFFSSSDLKVSTCFFRRDSIEVVIRHDGPADVNSEKFLRHLADLLQISDRYIHVSKLAKPIKFIRTSRVRPCPGNLLSNSYQDDNGDAVEYDSTLGPYLVDSNGELRRPNSYVLMPVFSRDCSNPFIKADVLLVGGRPSFIVLMQAQQPMAIVMSPSSKF